MRIGVGIGTIPIDPSPASTSLVAFPMARIVTFIWHAVLVVAISWVPASVQAAEPSSRSSHIWQQILTEAEGLGLPTLFLQAVPSDFVTFEFDDLHAFAAEYHLGEHRMVLNRALSFNTAGGTLRSLKRLTHGEIETLYHELFHAYMDYLTTQEGKGQPEPLLVFARQQQECRYSAVVITPVVQRRSHTEERFLSERESWEALNEAWAVFVGWAVWNQLGLGDGLGHSIQQPGESRTRWLKRLGDVDREGTLRGYYEPEDPTERAITRKRFLASGSRVSAREVERLLSDALGFSAEFVQQAVAVLEGDKAGRYFPNVCKKNSDITH